MRQVQGVGYLGLQEINTRNPISFPLCKAEGTVRENGETADDLYINFPREKKRMRLRIDFTESVHE